MKCRPLLILYSSFLILHFCSRVASAQSWPQWQGPKRDNVSAQKGLLTSWPKDGPKLLWQVEDLGEGYCTPTFDQGLIFGMSYAGEDEIVWARTIDRARPVWSTRIAKANREVDYHQGSRCSPTIDGERLYALGVSGDLVCLRVKDGEILWRTNLIKDYGGILPFYRESYGYTESPLVDGAMVVVTPGGDKHTVAAFDKVSGKHLWSAPVPSTKKGDNRAAYSSLVVSEVGGVRQYAQFLQGCLVGVSSKGDFLWRWDKPSNDIANCTTPIFTRDLVFASSGYGKGCGLAKIVPVKGEPGGVSPRSAPRFEVKEIYFNKAMKNVHGGIVLVDGHVYGNSDPGLLVCVEHASGKATWQERLAGKGSILYADGHLYYHDERGPMLLVEANPEKYVEKGRFTPPQRTRYSAWSHPVVLDGKLYVRDQQHLFCYDIRR